VSLLNPFDLRWPPLHACPAVRGFFFPPPGVPSRNSVRRSNPRKCGCRIDGQAGRPPQARQRTLFLIPPAGAWRSFHGPTPLWSHGKNQLFARTMPAMDGVPPFRFIASHNHPPNSSFVSPQTPLINRAGFVDLGPKKIDTGGKARQNQRPPPQNIPWSFGKRAGYRSERWGG